MLAMKNEKFNRPACLGKIIFNVLFFLFFGPTVFAKAPLKDTLNEGSNDKVLYGRASFYANKFNGRKTASGEIFSQKKMTCACNVLPFGTWIKVMNVENNKSVIVKVNDRLHPKMKRLVDLTNACAVELGYALKGVISVKVEVMGKHRPPTNQ